MQFHTFQKGAQRRSYEVCLLSHSVFPFALAAFGGTALHFVRNRNPVAHLPNKAFS
jgi:hypothetical protein